MSKRVVIKIGSSNLVSNGKVNEEKISKLAKIIKKYQEKDFEFIIVSSGAVAAGKEKLGIKNPKLSIREKQALSAIGQPLLMRKYKEAMNQENLTAAQVLLSGDDIYIRKRYINFRETVNQVLKYNAIPIINENDTISTEEIKIGDNDNLSALVSTATEADILIILSDIEGLYDKNPKTNPDAKLISDVKEITEEIIQNSGGAGSKVGTGGMKTKIEAANICMKFGVEMYIINGDKICNIEKILDEEKIGTKFHPEKNIKNKRKKWIAYGLKAKGEIFIDDGAKKALYNGKSLLASGIKKVEGSFYASEMISIKDMENNELARGLVNYNSIEISQIKGRASNEIEEILSYENGEEVIHRDNLEIFK